MTKKRMLLGRLAGVCAAAVAAGAILPVRGATTNTFYVAEGATLTVDQVIELLHK